MSKECFKPNRKLGSKKLISDINNLLRDITYEVKVLESDNVLSNDEAKLFIHFAKLLQKTSYIERKIMDYSEFKQLEYLSKIYILMNILLKQKSTLEYLKNSEDKAQVEHYKEISNNLKDFFETRDYEKILDTNTCEIIELYKSETQKTYHIESVELLLSYVKDEYYDLIESELISTGYVETKRYFEALYESAEWLNKQGYIDAFEKSCISEYSKSRVTRLISSGTCLEHRFSINIFNGIKFDDTPFFRDQGVEYSKHVILEKYEHLKKHGIEDEKVNLILYQSYRFSFYVYYQCNRLIGYIYDSQKGVDDVIESTTFEDFSKKVPPEIRKLICREDNKSILETLLK